VKRFLRSWLLVPALALTLSACHIDDEAELEAYWTFNGLGCRAAGVKYVEVILEDVHGFVYESGRVRCDAGSVFFDDLPRGLYWIEAYGYPSSRSGFTWELGRRIRLYKGYNEVTLDLWPLY